MYNIKAETELISHLKKYSCISNFDFGLYSNMQRAGKPVSTISTVVASVQVSSCKYKLIRLVYKQNNNVIGQ